MNRGRKYRDAFGEAVRKARIKAGLTQEELADKAGIDRSYIGGVERGERNPTLVVICKIADGLEVKLAELFDYQLPHKENGD